MLPGEDDSLGSRLPHPLRPHLPRRRRRHSVLRPRRLRQPLRRLHRRQLLRVSVRPFSLLFAVLHLLHHRRCWPPLR